MTVPETIPALTISQPYASLIACGAKWVENRTWETLYHGPLAIHAGSGTQYLTRQQLLEYPTGSVIAIVELVGCVHLDQLRRAARTGEVPRRLASRGLQPEFLRNLLDHEHTEGPFCWILRDVHPLTEPVSVGGKQKLWDWQIPELVELLYPLPSFTTNS